MCAVLASAVVRWVYHGMTIQPTEANFATSMPSCIDYEPFDQDYYPRVKARLRPAPIPDDVLAAPSYRASRMFLDAIAASGRKGSRVLLPVDWDFARAELRGAKGLIPDLPEGVGGRWGNNGDRIFSWTALGHSPGALQGGPACVGIKDWDNPAGALTIVLGPVPWPVDANTTTLIGFGIVEPQGQFIYDPVRDDAVLRWSQTYDAQLSNTTHGF